MSDSAVPLPLPQALIVPFRSCHLCRGLSEDEIGRLARLACPRQLKRGDLLFQEGDEAGGFFVLLTGRVRIYKSSPDGREHLLHMIQAGEMFAEAAMFHGNVFPASCDALEESAAVFFPASDFQNLLAASPSLSLKIIASMAAFVRHFNRMVADLSLREVPSRLASFLLAESARQKSRRIELDISRSELAARLGTVPETLSRALRRLREAEFISVNHRLITLRDPEGLKDAAEGILPQ